MLHERKDYRRRVVEGEGSMPSDNHDEEFSPAELAKRVGVSVGLIRRLMRDKKLEYRRYSEKVRKIRWSAWVAYRDSVTYSPET